MLQKCHIGDVLISFVRPLAWTYNIVNQPPIAPDEERVGGFNREIEHLHVA